jgi:hypothetical protein
VFKPRTKTLQIAGVDVMATQFSVDQYDAIVSAEDATDRKGFLRHAQEVIAQAIGADAEKLKNGEDWGPSPADTLAGYREIMKFAMEEWPKPEGKPVSP